MDGSAGGGCEVTVAGDRGSLCARTTCPSWAQSSAHKISRAPATCWALFLTYLALPRALLSGASYAHFKDGQTEAQKSNRWPGITQPRSEAGGRAGVCSESLPRTAAERERLGVVGTGMGAGAMGVLALSGRSVVGE